MHWEYYPEEIGQILCEDTYDDCTQEDERFIKAKEGLEWLKAAAENPYNADYFRGLYQVLQDYASVHEGYLK